MNVDLKECPRCGEPHPNLEIQPLDRPLLIDRRFTHWAPCPTNGQPIFSRDPKATR